MITKPIDPQIFEIIKENSSKSTWDIFEILEQKGLNLNIHKIRVIRDDYRKQIEDTPIFMFNPEWRDNTPTNHRLTKTYRQLIKNEFNDGEVVGKKAN
jgi:CDP-glycerol glycerophosphotransferase (TagB/SpsB family)